MFRQVPVLPIVLPIAIVAFLGLLWSLQRRNRLSLPRAALAAALCVYLAGVIANTVFPIFLDKPSSPGSWSTFLNVVPVTGYEVVDAVTNIVIFVPVGIMVALMVTRPSWARVVTIATAFSLTIEAAQYITAHTLGGGHVADVNDLLSNAAGSALGFGLLSLLERVPAARGLIDRFRWR